MARTMKQPPLLCCAVPTGKAAPILEVAARQAFWDLTGPQMRAIASHLQYEIQAGSDEFTT
eukprot:14530610-Heterocapsa_arctica.AAC.1